MEKLIKAAGVHIIVGILCAGIVGFLAYKQYKDKKISTQKKRLSGSKGSLKLARKRDERIGSVSDACLENITKVEEKSFKEINDLFQLDQDKLQLMTDFLVESGILEKSNAVHISSFTDILIQLRHRKILGPTNYFDVLQRIFTEIGYDISNEKSLLADNTKALVREVIGQVGRGHHRDDRVDEDQKIDIIVLYSDNDHKDAKRMVDNIRQRVSVEDLQVELTDTVCPGGMLNISAFGKVLESCLYIFIMITPSFNEDELQRFLGETGLVSDLKSNEHRWRFVPIWMTKEMSQSQNVPFEYSGLKGINYFRYLNDNSHVVCFQIMERMVNEGRKKEKRRAEMERRKRKNLQE